MISLYISSWLVFVFLKGKMFGFILQDSLWPRQRSCGHILLWRVGLECALGITYWPSNAFHCCPHDIVIPLLWCKVLLLQTSRLRNCSTVFCDAFGYSPLWLMIDRSFTVTKLFIRKRHINLNISRQIGICAMRLIRKHLFFRVNNCTVNKGQIK